MLKKAKLIWTKRGYRVEHCKWTRYTPSTWKHFLVHDMFEHSPTDSGQGIDEIRAVGAKLRFGGVYTYWDDRDKRSYFENRKFYKRKKSFMDVTYHKKGEAGFKTLAKVHSRFGNYNHILKTIKEGYRHALQFNEKAYYKAFTINFPRYYDQGVDLEISLVTGRVLKKLPKTS